MFTTEGGITNKTWEGEGGTEIDRLARPMDPEDFLVEIPLPDVDCKFTVDIDPDYQGWPVWQNPINVIDKVIYEQLGSFLFEEVVSLPTMPNEVLEQYLAWEDWCKANDKHYDLTIDEQIKRLDKNIPDVKKVDLTGYLRAEYVQIKFVKSHNTEMITELPQTEAFLFYKCYHDTYEDPKEHYPPNLYVEDTQGVKQSDLLKKYFNELLD